MYLVRGASKALLIDLGNDDYYGTGTADDLATSSVLAPLPGDAHRPAGW